MKLKVERFLQDPACCAVAASSSIANFYNKDIVYDLAKNVAEDIIGDEVIDGLYTGEIGQLLNFLGFKEVKIISSDINYLDYSLNKMKNKKLIENLKTGLRTNKNYKENIKSMMKFLGNEEYTNEVVVDYHFGKYIRENIKKGIPLLLTFNWTLFFGLPKYNDKGIIDANRGDYEEHAVVVNGFDEKGVFIVDSQKRSYTGKLKKYRDGYYHVLWEDILPTTTFSDLIIPKKYSKNMIKYQ